jgi:hypothetical protein
MVHRFLLSKRQDSLFLEKFVLFLLLTSAALLGCKAEHDSREERPVNEPVYKRERIFTFLASHFNEEGALVDVDTLVFTTGSDSFNEKYNQTTSSWSSPSGRFITGYSGVAEHDTAVWIHPPRDGAYRKLELAPFPMVKYPLEVGNKWIWKLEVGGHYSVPGHAEWPATTNRLFTSTYQISRETILTTPVGKVNCYEIDSFTISDFEQTRLKAFYNPGLGFVRLEYATIDRRRLIMELLNVQNAVPKSSLPFKDLPVQL